MVKRYELSDARWRRIEGLLPGKPAIPAAPPRTIVSSSTVSCGCCALARTGMTCRGDMANGKASTRFARWAKNGVWERVFNVLTKDRKNEYLMLDTTLVRAHQQAATGKGGTKTRLWGDPEED
jgi:transposase